MKSVKILIAVLIVSLGARGQFPTTDSIKRYTDKYINNNATNAFQNLRLNQILKALASQIDSSNARITGGVRVVDTMYVNSLDSTLRFVIKNTSTGAISTYTIPINATGGGGITYHEGQFIDITGTTVALDTAATNPLYTAYWKPGTLAGSGTIGDAYTTRQIVSTAKTSLRTLLPDPTTIYRVLENSIVQDFRYDASDVTSADDGVMVLRNGAARFKRIITDKIDIRWFGASSNGDPHLNRLAIQACFDWCKNSGYRYSMYIPTGQFPVDSTLSFVGDATTGQFPRITGEGKGIGSAASTIVWAGAKGGTLVKIRHMIYSSIENVDFQGRNGSDTTKLPKYLLWFARETADDYSTFNRVVNCTFYTCGGDSSAMVNLNFGGVWQGTMMDEITFEGCKFAGNGFDVANKSAFGVIIGGANTKNFNFNHNSFIGFSKAAIKAFYCGPLHTIHNTINNCERAFDLDNGTTLLSETDYTESAGQVFGTPGGGAMGSFMFKGLEDHSFNYKGAISAAYGYTVPETNPYRMEGVGQLTLEGCTFDNAPGSPGVRGDSLTRIHWEVMQDRSALTAINNNFSGAREGRTPFYSQSVRVGMQDHTENPAITGQVHLTAINNKGIDSVGQISIFLPNVMADESYLVKGINKITTSVGKPTTGTWRTGDKVLNTYNSAEGPGGDGRHRVPSYIVTHSGTFKTINITGTYSVSNWITNLSDSTKVDVGDILELSGGFSGGGYVFEVAEKQGKKIRISGITGLPSTGTGTVTITNAIPVFTAEGRGFGTTALRPGSTYLGTNDKGWQYWNTDSSKLQVWDGAAYSTIAGSGAAGSFVTFTGNELISGVKTFYNAPPYVLSDGSNNANIKVEADAGNAGFLFYRGGAFRYDFSVASGNDIGIYSSGVSGYPWYAYYSTGAIQFIKARYGIHPSFTAADSLFLPDKKYVDSIAGASGVKKIRNYDPSFGYGFLHHISADSLYGRAIEVSGVLSASMPAAPADTVVTISLSQQTVQNAAAPTKQSSTSTGSTLTITSQTGDIWLIINPATIITSLTITMPLTPVDKQLVTMSFGGTIVGGNVVTSLTVSPNISQTILQATLPSNVEAGEAISYRYESSTGIWRRIL